MESTTTVAAAPWVAFLAPYVNLLVASLIPILIGWFVAMISKYTHVQIEASAVDAIKSAAATSAGKLVAASETNLAGQTFDVHSAAVKTIADEVIAVVPGAIKALGDQATPEAVQRIVVGEIGKLQASTPAPVSAK